LEILATFQNRTKGLGRLIRSRKDRGVLALLDDRITRMRYGSVFFESLPAVLLHAKPR
jgi:ATP-dependent DNA helicase DinG